MKIQEIISEARRNPRQNLGKPDRRELLQYLHSLPEDVLRRTFVHSSTVDKIGINPSDQAYATESSGHITGVYCWTAETVIDADGDVGFADIRPYQFVIELKEDPTELTEELWDDLWDTVYQQVEDPKNNPKYKQTFTPEVQKAGALSAKLLKQMGITALEDMEGILSGNPGEGLIVSLSAIKHYKRFVNHIRPDSEVDWEGSYSDDDIYAHASGKRLVDYANRTTRPLSLEQEKKLLNLFPLSIDANRQETNNLYATLQPYIDNVLIPHNQKFKLPKLNNIVYNSLTGIIQMIENNLTDEYYQKEYQKWLPYLKYFSQ